MASYREQSRREWTRHQEGDTEDLTVGCLQRIADATEKMARSYNTLIEERDRYKRYYEEGQNHCKRLERRIYSLRGVITKLKKRGVQA